jgi:hypothetical protein
MKRSSKAVFAGIVVVLGIVLMIGGIVIDKHGATVVGIIIAGVAAQQYMVLLKKDRPGR